MKFSKYCCLVAKSCTTLCNLLDWIFQARVLEWVAISFSRGSSRPSDRTQVSCTAGRHFSKSNCFVKASGLCLIQKWEKASLPTDTAEKGLISLTSTGQSHLLGIQESTVQSTVGRQTKRREELPRRSLRDKNPR